MAAKGGGSFLSSLSDDDLSQLLSVAKGVGGKATVGTKNSASVGESKERKVQPESRTPLRSVPRIAIASPTTAPVSERPSTADSGPNVAEDAVSLDEDSNTVEGLQKELLEALRKIEQLQDENIAHQTTIEQLNQTIQSTSTPRYFGVPSASGAGLKDGVTHGVSSDKATKQFHEMRHKLQTETLARTSLAQQNAKLKKECQHLQTQLLEQQQMSGSAVENMQQQLEETYSKLAIWQQKAADAGEQASEAAKLSDALKEREHQLRDLIKSLAERKVQSEAPLKAQQDFWEKLATPEVLELSQPPEDFPVPQLQPFNRDEFYKMRARLIASEKAVQELQQRVEALSQEKQNIQASRLLEIKNLNAKVVKQQTHLIGAVRRVKYLLSERDKLQVELKEKEAYSNKLETKLLQLSEQLNQLRTPTTDIVQLQKKVESKSNPKDTKFGAKKMEVAKPRRSESPVLVASRVVQKLRDSRPSSAKGTSKPANSHSALPSEQFADTSQNEQPNVRDGDANHDRVSSRPRPGSDVPARAISQPKSLVDMTNDVLLALDAAHSRESLAALAHTTPTLNDSAPLVVSASHPTPPNMESHGMKMSASTSSHFESVGSPRRRKFSVSNVSLPDQLPHQRPPSSRAADALIPRVRSLPAEDSEDDDKSRAESLHSKESHRRPPRQLDNSVGPGASEAPILHIDLTKPITLPVKQSRSTTSLSEHLQPHDSD